ncbi:Rieske (2Fe-2S) protein [Ktedonosporobacter rubrisoli]|uniref:Rieske (2Fe-2S) protein n=1 Tax=Ktedonosporobacter rubrisoli TaxID=2509675 RepID=A0A4P6JML8_KTERU|nr:Rieske 2Fe-2S domain-containing protein [Ktedonosporobacter rubrisoli]QBD76518.1 Rieske (2Fe-2S) protein [Ktedonosporobacter rubrisoli]
MTTNVMPTPNASWVDTPPISPPLRRANGRLLTRMSWLDKLSNPLQKWLHKVYGQPGQPSYKIKDWLNGVWLGHTLHPVLVDIPLGAWMVSTMFDLCWLGNNDRVYERGADMALWLGLAGATGAAASGLTQWADTDGPERRTGMLHGLLNGGITVLNLTSALLRLGGQRRTAITLSTTAYAVALYSAYLGGELAYSSGVGANHVAWEGGSDDFVAVMDEKDLAPGKLTRVDAAGIPAVLYKDGSSIYALAATCSHMGGPLDEGRCEKGVVYCPWHNSGFNLQDGSVANSPAVYAQPTFAVRTRNGKIELRRLEHA